jgi:hypothetical protein
MKTNPDPWFRLLNRRTFLRNGALLNVSEAPYDNRFNLSELAAWTMVASTLLNLDETMTKG